MFQYYYINSMTQAITNVQKCNVNSENTRWQMHWKDQLVEIRCSQINIGHNSAIGFCKVITSEARGLYIFLIKDHCDIEPNPASVFNIYSSQTQGTRKNSFEKMECKRWLHKLCRSQEVVDQLHLWKVNVGILCTGRFFNYCNGILIGHSLGAICLTHLYHDYFSHFLFWKQKMTKTSKNKLSK